jgi:hypothetical protein
MQRRMDRSIDHRDDEADPRLRDDRPDPRACSNLTLTRALLLPSAPAPPGKVPRQKPHPTPCRAVRATAFAAFDVGSKRHRTGSWRLHFWLSFPGLLVFPRSSFACR